MELFPFHNPEWKISHDNQVEKSLLDNFLVQTVRVDRGINLVGSKLFDGLFPKFLKLRKSFLLRPRWLEVDIDSVVLLQVLLHIGSRYCREAIALIAIQELSILGIELRLLVVWWTGVSMDWGSKSGWLGLLGSSIFRTSG